MAEKMSWMERLLMSGMENVNGPCFSNMKKNAKFINHGMDHTWHKWEQKIYHSVHSFTVLAVENLTYPKCHRQNSMGGKKSKAFQFIQGEVLNHSKGQHRCHLSTNSYITTIP